MSKLTSRVLLIFIVLNMFFIRTSMAYEDIDRYSRASILIDQLTGRVLYEKNPDKKMPLASLSKMMTFLIAIEAIENKEVGENDIVKIDEEAARVRGSSYKLKNGEEIPLIELMKGLMIVSGNDASIAIAKHISKDVDTFVDRMNKKARQLGMKSTYFVNPNGLPIYGDKVLENISTARDIAVLAKYMFDNYEKEVTAITDMETYTYEARGFCKNNTNVLLRLIPEVDGVKTGYTGNAGYCLCFSMKLDEGDLSNRVIGVVLGTNHKEKRTKSSLALLKFARENFETKKIIERKEIIGRKYVDGFSELEIELSLKDDLYVVLKKDEKLKREITLKELDYPVDKGEVVGLIKYYDENGNMLAEGEVISERALDDISLKTKLKRIFK